MSQSAAHADVPRTPVAPRALPWRHAWALAPLVYFAGLVAWVGDAGLVARLINDDPSYYILVARNLFVRGPSYDGLYLTNGVHPLFALGLGLIYRVLPLPFEVLGLVSILVCVACGSGFLALLLRLRPSDTATRVALTALLGSIAVYPILYRGMEGALALFAIGLYLWALQRRTSVAGWCLLASMLWAARLELLALPPLVAFCASQAGALEPAARRRLLAGWLGSWLVLGAYFVASYLGVGMALPVSGLIKQTSMGLHPLFIGIGVSCGLVALALAVLPGLRPLARRAFMTHALLGFCAVFYLAHAWGQQDTERQTWYYFPLPALLALGWVELAGTAPSFLRRAGAVAAVCLALVATLWEGAYVIPLRRQAWSALRNVASDAKRAAVPGERFMGPGWMALLVGPEFEPFSQDGLVGGVEQYRALREGRLFDFAYASNVRYLFSSSLAPAADGPAPPVPGYQLSLVSTGAVPNGGSLWGWLTRNDPCGLGRCESFVSIYRLAPAEPRGTGTHDGELSALPRRRLPQTQTAADPYPGSAAAH